MHGLITHIQRFSLHDGPGIRSTVFLKGCQLRCAWCHNPETMRPQPELQVFPMLCIGCGACVLACPAAAHTLTAAGHQFDRARCTGCGACAAECFAGALVSVGKRVTPDEILQEVRQDRAFYAESGGGVTLSGGEPLFQREFTLEVLCRCRAEGMHTAIETNLIAPWTHYQEVLPHVDLVMCDIKFADAARHQQATGVLNERVLENIRHLAATGLPVIVRTPVVPGYTDTMAEIAAIAKIIAGLPNVQYYELLPFHPLGAGKYHSLDMPCTCEGLSTPTPETMSTLAEIAKRAGIAVRVAGKTV